MGLSTLRALTLKRPRGWLPRRVRKVWADKVIGN